MPPERMDSTAQALSLLPCSLFVLTAAFEDSASGVLVRWVQRCSLEPPMVMVAIRRGQPVEPLIRDSRAFALCQLASDDRFLRRKFAAPSPAPDEAFMSVPIRPAPSGSPIIERAMSYLDCELLRNIELDSDHRVYIGQVKCGEMLHKAKPGVYFGANGLSRTPADGRGRGGRASSSRG